MSVEWVAAAIERGPREPRENHIFLYLATRSGNGRGTSSRMAVSAATHWSVRVVTRRLEALVDAGWVSLSDDLGTAVHPFTYELHLGNGEVSR